MTCFLCFLRLLFLPLHSEEADPALPYFEEFENAKEVPDSRFYEEFIKMLFTLGAVVSLLFATTWYIKRLTRERLTQQRKTSRIQIREQFPLSPKTTIYWLEIEGEQFVLAESGGGVTMFHKHNPNT